jgi:hypothetical protein
MKTYGGVEVEINVLFVSVIVGGKPSASRSRRFITGERPPRHTDCVGPRAGLDDVEKWTF